MNCALFDNNGKKFKLKKLFSIFIYRFQKIVYANDEIFFSGKLTHSKNNLIALNKRHVIKLENYINPNKRNSLKTEIKYLDLLTKNKNITSPKLIASGKHITGRPYFIMERFNKSKKEYNISDIILSILELHKSGVFHQDITDSNVIFDGSIAHIIDYDQAEIVDDLKLLPPDESIKYFSNRQSEYWIKHSNIKGLESTLNGFKEQIEKSFINKSFDFSQTSLYSKMMLYGNKYPYYSLNDYGIFSYGKFDIKNITENLLDKLDFKPQEKILDLGCDIGTLSFYLNSKTKNVYSFDLNPNSLICTNILSNIIGQKSKTINKIDFSDTYDTIFLLNDCILNILPHKLLLKLGKRSKRVFLKTDKSLKKDIIKQLRLFTIKNEYKFDSNEFSILDLEKI